MARQKGESTFVKIPLSALVAKLKDTPNIKIAVGKGNLKELASALEVDFSEFMTESTPAAEAVAEEASEGKEGDSGDLGGMVVA